MFKAQIYRSPYVQTLAVRTDRSIPGQNLSLHLLYVRVIIFVNMLSLPLIKG